MPCRGDPGLEFRFIELGGETGECMEAAKKYLLAKKGMAGGVHDLRAIADEIADVIISAANLANDLNMDLSEIVPRKFNETSEKYGFPQRL